MARQVQFRGGPTEDMEGFIGAFREVTVDTTKKTLVVHDGVTPGGFPLAHEIALGQVDGDGILHIVKIFQQDYDLLDPPDDETLYVIVPLRFNLEPVSFDLLFSDLSILG